MAKTDQELAQDILDGEGINWRYGGDTIAGALMPFRREVLAPEQSQFIGYDDRGQAIIQNIPAQYGETQFDLSYSPAVQSLQGVGSALRDVFFGDANTQAKAVNQAVSTLRGVAGGIADYASGQYKAAMGGGTIYDPSTREVTEFDPTAVLLSNAPAGIQAVRNAPPNTMTLGAAGGRMNPPRDINAKVASAKAAYDSNPNNEELRRAYMALRRERDDAPPAPRIVRGKGSSIPVYHGSPHKFNQFSMDSIGTGEGAQAYGYGLYFADSPDVARSYRDQLSESSGTIDGRSIMDDYNVIIDRADNLPPASAQLEYDKAAFLEDLALTDDVAESISRIENPEVAKWARREVSPKFEPAGYTYEANLNVPADDLLDWDTPLSEQSEKVQNALGRNDKWTTGASFYHLKSGAIDDQLTEKSGELYDFIQSHPKFNAEKRNFSSGEVISSWLNSKGVSGIRYYDGVSRNAKEGTRNYVMFDDSLIDTKRVNDQPTESWMNPEARMQRAQDLGFEEDIYYKGMYPYDYTKESGDYRGPEITEINRPDEFPAFNNGEKGVDIAGFLTKDPEVANRFAGSDGRGAVYPLRYRRGEVYTIDANGRNAGELQFGESGKEFRDAVRSGNYDTIEIINTADEGDITISTKPENIRSTNAEFDPAKADSADLLSSVGATSALRGIV